MTHKVKRREAAAVRPENGQAFRMRNMATGAAMGETRTMTRTATTIGQRQDAEQLSACVGWEIVGRTVTQFAELFRYVRVREEVDSRKMVPGGSPALRGRGGGASLDLLAGAALRTLATATLRPDLAHEPGDPLPGGT